MKRESSLWWKLTALAVLCLLALMLSSCGDYKRYTMHDGLAEFSFEYPAYYLRPALLEYPLEYRVSYGNPAVDEAGIEFATMVKTGYGYSVGNDFHVETLSVDVYSTNAFIQDSKDLIEFHLDFYETDPFIDFFIRDVRLLDRVPVTVAGFQGERIVYSYSRIPGTLRAEGPRYPSIAHEVSFDANGLVWSIISRADIEGAEKAEAGFEHLLETLKILD